MRLENKVAVVSGAGGPMGMAVAKRFAEEGACVTITDISGSRLEHGATQIREACGHEGRVAFLRADVSNRSEVNAVADLAESTFGRVDILANIVGGYRGAHYQGPALMSEMSEERWDSTFALNLKPNLYFVQRLAPGMTERGYGKIVNISSINMAGEGGSADYGAAKAAVASMTRTLAIELAPHVNVNCIAPGIIRTRVIAMIGEEVAEEYRKRSLLGRLGEPADIANAALFLVTDESNYITGEMLPVAGGIWPAL